MIIYLIYFVLLNCYTLFYLFILFFGHKCVIFVNSIINWPYNIMISSSLWLRVNSSAKVDFKPLNCLLEIDQSISKDFWFWFRTTNVSKFYEIKKFAANKKVKWRLRKIRLYWEKRTDPPQVDIKTKRKEFSKIFL